MCRYVGSEKVRGVLGDTENHPCLLQNQPVFSINCHCSFFLNEREKDSVLKSVAIEEWFDSEMTLESLRNYFINTNKRQVRSLEDALKTHQETLRCLEAM